MVKLLLGLLACGNVFAAQVTVSELFMLAQQKPLMAQVYVAGVLDTSRGAFWCSNKEPSAEKVLDLAVKRIVEAGLDPNAPADFAIVPILMAAAPCRKGDNI